MRAIFNESLEENPASCGVAIQSQYNGQADVTVRITSEKDAEYRLILYAVERMTGEFIVITHITMWYVNYCLLPLMAINWDI